MKKKITAIFLCIALAATAIVGASLAYFTDTTDAAKNVFTMGKVDISLDETKWVESDSHVLLPGKCYDKNPTIHVEKDSQNSYVFLDMYFNKYNPLFWVMAADASADEKINFTIYNNNGTIKDEFLNDNSPKQFSTTKFIEYMTQRENKAVFQQIVNKWFIGITHEDWEVVKYDWGEINENCFTVRLRYIGGDNDGIMKAGDSVTFMTKFQMPSSVTEKMISDGQDVAKQGNPLQGNLKIYFKAYAIQAEGLTAETAYSNLFPSAQA